MRALRRTTWLLGAAILVSIGLFSVGRAATIDPNATRSQLEQQIQQLQKEIAGYQQQLATAKSQAKSLTNALVQLQAKQKTLALQIKQTNLRLADVDARTAETLAAITQSETTLATLQKEISSVLRDIQKRDLVPTWQALLTAGGLADLSNEAMTSAKISERLRDSYGQAKIVRDRLIEQRLALADERESVVQLLDIKALQQQDLQDATAEKNTLLKQTRGRESDYQQAIASSQKQVAAIRSRIYQLLAVEKQITFGQAAEIATWASKLTGVRPAFLLAVLSQESSLGANVGTCNRKGDPPSKSWRVIMKPERDQAPFQQITRELGLDVDTTPVSCPMRDKNGNQVGWGGAMGAAQFIPSTWMGYRSKVSALTGKATANPWDVRDAFVAAGLYLKNAGADGTRTGEWNAAMRYFSGTVNVAYRFYGDSVLEKADGYQADLDQLAGKK